MLSTPAESLMPYKVIYSQVSWLILCVNLMVLRETQKVDFKKMICGCVREVVSRRDYI